MTNSSAAQACYPCHHSTDFDHADRASTISDLLKMEFLQKKNYLWWAKSKVSIAFHSFPYRIPSARTTQPTHPNPLALVSLVSAEARDLQAALWVPRSGATMIFVGCQEMDTGQGMTGNICRVMGFRYVMYVYVYIYIYTYNITICTHISLSCI